MTIVSAPTRNKPTASSEYPAAAERLRSRLRLVVSYARSGALEKAEQLFEEAGLLSVTDNAAVLSVRGRLLKDRAKLAHTAQKRELYARSADMYAQAAVNGGGSYPLINVATLSLLAGKAEYARVTARKVLDYHDDAETPYWKCATHAEALLLLGDMAQAELLLKRALRCAPRAYEDHASTIRQFSLILIELGKPDGWLDAFRPPRSMHYAGPIGLRPNAQLKRSIHSILEEERIGFGYGSLAAGTDILVAENLLKRNAELHIILPFEASYFRSIFVRPAGQQWVERFDKILKGASSVRATNCSEMPFKTSPLLIEFSAQIAMGGAVMHANVLATDPVQLIVLQSNSSNGRDGAVSRNIGKLWNRSGRRQRVISAKCAPNSKPVFQRRGNNRILSILRVDLSLEPDSTKVLRKLAQLFLRNVKGAVQPRWTGDGLEVVFESPAIAADTAIAAMRMLRSTEARSALHHCIVSFASDPFANQQFVCGPGVVVVEKVASNVPIGAIHATEDFAAALSGATLGVSPRAEFIGETCQICPDTVIKLFSIKA